MASFKHTFTSGQTVTPARLNDARDVFDIVNANIKSDAAIVGTKIAPNFGSQNVTTTGSFSGKDMALTECLSAYGSITASAAAGNSAYINLGTAFTSGYVSFDRANNAMAVWNATNGLLTFGTNNAERMRITADGSVGVGTSSPSVKFDVNGIVNTNANFAVDGTQVVTNRQTGWGIPTGTATRSAFATSSVTLEGLAQRVKALIDDLRDHGLIGA